MRLAAVAVLYAATAKGGLALAADTSNVTAIWPPTGIALAALVIWGRNMWPAVAIGAVLANAGTGVPALTIAGIATGNTLEALAGAAMLALVGFRPSLPRLRDVVALVTLAGMVSTLISATIGIASLRLGGAIDAGAAGRAWLTWWLGDMGGDLLVAPLLLLLATRKSRDLFWPRATVVEASALLLVTLAVSLAAFSQEHAIVFVTFPVIVWASVRFRQAGAATATLLVASVAIVFAARGHGPFSDGSLNERLLLAQLFGGVACASALVLGVITGERERAAADLRRAHDELEEKVRERTAALTGAHARIAARHELAAVGSWEWNVENDTLTWSRELRAIYGLPAEHPNPTYAGYLARVHPDDRARVTTTVERSLATGRPFTMEERIVRPDGSVRTLASGGQVLCDSQGRPQRMVGICQDVTESRRAGQALLESQERARRIVDASSHAFVSMDEAGTITDWNPAAERLLGYRRDEAVGRLHADSLVPEHMRARHREGLARFVLTGESGLLGRPVEVDALHRDGHVLRVELSISAIKTHAGYSFNAFVQDISARTRAKRLLATENAVGRALLESASLPEARPRVLAEICEGLGWVYGGWWSLDGAAGVLRRDAAWWSPAIDATPYQQSYEQPTSVPGVGLLGRVWQSGETILICDPAEDTDCDHRPAAATTNSCVIGVPIVSRGEVVAAIEFVAMPGTLGAETREMMGRLTERVVRYVERDRFEDRLQHLADHDALTDLFNNRRFEEELAREVAAAHRYGTRGAVLALDLDNLKHVNDTLGHDAGNELIARVADLVRTRLRATDTVARIGGDEFAAILPHVDEAHARHIASELLDVIREQAVVSTTRGLCRTSASIGITVFSDRADQPTGEELLIEADMAMYEAKEAGRDRLHVYDPQTSRDLRRTWAEQIRTALATGRFTLHAQPIISLQRSDDRPRHELLVRMIGTEGDLIAPAMFLSIAERLNLVQEVDRWVVRNAIALLAEHERKGHDARFDINLSARSIVDPELPALIEHEVAATGVDASSLTFEVTETVAVTDIDRARRFIRSVGELGCGLALDDFGTGFASFSNLKHLPFDEVKIDGEFIDDLPSNAVNQLIVRSVVEIARGLGMKTIAECVADDATLELLRSYGVDYAQGFHLGRPVPTRDVAASAIPL